MNFPTGTPLIWTKIVLNTETKFIYACFLPNSNHLPKVIQNRYFRDYHFVLQSTLLSVLEIELTFKNIHYQFKKCPLLPQLCLPNTVLLCPLHPIHLDFTNSACSISSLNFLRCLFSLNPVFWSMLLLFPGRHIEGSCWFLAVLLRHWPLGKSYCVLKTSSVAVVSLCKEETGRSRKESVLWVIFIL